MSTASLDDEADAPAKNEGILSADSP